MTLVQLEYIIAVDTYRHFARAAERSFVTQPTLSMQIQKLEDLLGITIFDRSQQPVVPTEIGEKIIAQARKVVQESKKIQAIIEEEKSEVSGELRVGIIPTLSPYLLPLFVQHFMEAYPNVSLKVEELLTDELADRLRKEMLDVGLFVTPYNDSMLIEKPIFYEEFFAYLSHREPVFKKELLQADDLEDINLWLLTEGHCFREQVLNFCHPGSKQKTGRFQYESGSLETLKRFVDKYGGVTLIPETATLDFDQNEKAHLRRFAKPKPVREVSLVVHQSFLKQKLAEALYHEIHKAIPEYLESKKSEELITWK